MVALDFTPDQLDAPDAASCISNYLASESIGGSGNETWLTSKLHLVLASTFDGFLPRYQRLQGRAISNAAERGQYLRDAVIGEHGDFIDVPESAVAFSIEATPNVRD